MAGASGKCSFMNDRASKNVAIFNQWLSAFNAHDVTGALKFVSENIRLESPILANPVLGREEAGKFWGKLFLTFPDWHLTPTNLIANDYYVVAESKLSGTQKGELKGIAPTDRPVKFSSVLICQLDAGLIARLSSYFDFYTILTQLKPSANIH